VSCDLVRRAKRVAEVAALHADSVDREGRFPAEAVAALKTERLLGLQVPTQYGGEGAGLAQIAEVCCTLGQACSASAMVSKRARISSSCSSPL